MSRKIRTTSVLTALAVLMALPVTAGARAPDTRDVEPVREVVEPRPAEEAEEPVPMRSVVKTESERVRPVARPAEVTPTTRPLSVPATQTRDALVVERPEREEPVDRCARVADNPRRCVQQNEPEHNYRQLFWRIFYAGEWRMLLRLLSHLGIL